MNLTKLIPTVVRLARPVVKAAPSVIAAVTAVKNAAKEEKRKHTP